MSSIASLLFFYSFNVAYFDIAGPRYHLVAIIPSCMILARVSKRLTRREALLSLVAVNAAYLAVYLHQGTNMREEIREKRALELAVQEAGLARALVLVPDGWPGGIYSRDLLDNAPDFSGMIYALDIPRTNQELLDHFGGIPAHRWCPEGSTLSRASGKLEPLP